MFFGYYRGFAKFEIYGFDTREELETWLDYREPFSLAFGASPMSRHELKDKRLIKRLHEDKGIFRTKDIDGFHLFRLSPNGEISKEEEKAIRKAWFR